MAENIPEGVPATLTAGNTWQWTQRLSDYAPTETGGTWALSYAINGVGSLKWDASWVTNDGLAWTVTIPAASTAGLPAGRYQWAAIVTGGGGYDGQRYTPDSGILTIAPNPATAAQGDFQTHAEKALSAVEAVLEGRITADIQAYAIGGRSVTSIPVLELRKLRAQYRDEVWRERHPGQTLPSVNVAFGVVR